MGGEFDKDADEAWWEGFSQNFEPITRAEAMADIIVYEPGYKKSRGNKPLERVFKKNRRVRIIAYDLETTNIKVGTPDVVYLTAFAAGPKPFRLSMPIRGRNPDEHKANFLFALENHLLIPENKGVRFVAWNGNKYDALLAAVALLKSDDWIIHPYLTRSNSVRGMKLEGRNSKKGLHFELLDGMAMTGLDTVSMPLKKFLKMFAPDHLAKLELDFEKESFNPDNLEHVAYAERDSEGLWHAMQNVNRHVLELTGNELGPTLGRAAIQYFASQMPEGVKVWRPNEELFEILHERAKRGGYVWIAKQYKGPIWKYDLNQAYAGAMRDCDLPAGTAINCGAEYQENLPGVYRCWIARRDPSPVPFYFKYAETGEAGFTSGNKVETWILSTEIEHLQQDGWSIEITDGWFWPEKFRMTEFVDRLEQKRFSDPDGPSGPLGTIIKVIGNGSYGKTLERLDGVSLVMAKTCPEGMTQKVTDSDIPIYVDIGEPHKAPYHQPQIGCFITAHVRLQVRDAAIIMPNEFVYADTDCVGFTAPAMHLDIDPRRYGAWKAESQGVEYIFIGKKVYFGIEADGSVTKHAKGLRVKELTQKHFEDWYAGEIPKQTQLQRVNFLKMVGGADMFHNLERTGTDVKKLKTVRFDGKNFLPLGEPTRRKQKTVKETETA